MNVGAVDGDAAVEAFIRTQPAALFYHSSSYRQLLVEHLGCEDRTLVARDGGAVRGVMPLLFRDGVYNSLPYYGSNGGVLATGDEAASALVAAYDALAVGSDTVSATVIENPFGAVAPAPAHTLVDERIAQFTDLRGDPMARAESSARRNVRRAEAAGITVRIDPDALQRLYELHDANIRALGGRPKQRAFFDLVGTRLREGDEWRLFAAYRNGEMVAGLLLFYFGTTVEYFTPAIDHRHRAEQPLAAILAEAIPDAAERGFERWNWGGTWLSQESLLRFKRKWGAEERRYRYFVQLNRDELLDETPESLRERFGDFFVLPYSALRHG